MDISMRATAKDANAACAHHKPFPRFTGELLVCCERQRLVLGSVLLERVQGVGSIVAQDVAACRLLFQLTGRSKLSVGGRLAELTAGHWSPVTNQGVQLEVERGGEVVLLSFASGNLSRNISTRSQAHMLAALPIRGASRMCLELARCSLAQSEPLSGSVADAMGDAEIELATLAIIEELFRRGGETVRETVRARIKSYIQRNLADPELTIERIAKRMQCTKRYLHKVFSDHQQTLNQYIW